MLNHKILLTFLLGAAVVLTTGCAPGHLAGGGRLLPCNDLNCSAPAQNTVLLPFSIDLNAADGNGDGVIATPGVDRVTGHFNLTLPAQGGAAAAQGTQGVNRIRAKAIWGGVCSEFDQGCNFNPGSGPIGGRIQNLTSSQAAQDFIRVHPKVGIAAMIAFFRLSGKNADTCNVDQPDSDCVLIGILAADLDGNLNISNGDFVLIFDELNDPVFLGLVQNGNISITQETVPAP